VARGEPCMACKTEFDPRDGGSRPQITPVSAVLFAISPTSRNDFALSVVFCFGTIYSLRGIWVLGATPSVTRVWRGTTEPSGISARHLPLLIGRLGNAFFLRFFPALYLLFLFALFYCYFNWLKTASQNRKKRQFSNHGLVGVYYRW